MATINVLEKFKNAKDFVFPVFPASYKSTGSHKSLETTLDKRISSLTPSHRNVARFVDADGNYLAAYPIDRFIWNIWKVPGPLNFLKDSRLIVTKLSLPALEELVSLLYNGVVSELIDFEIVLELIQSETIMELKNVIMDKIMTALIGSVSLQSLQCAWGSGNRAASFSITSTNPYLINSTVSYIICNPAKVFDSYCEAWEDMALQVLKLLQPSVLFNSLKTYNEFGATAQNRQIYCTENKAYLKISHFRILNFLVQWARRKYGYIMITDLNVEVRVSHLKQELQHLIDLVDADKMNITLFEHHHGKDPETFERHVAAFVFLKTMESGGSDEKMTADENILDLPVLIHHDDPEFQQQKNKKPRWDVAVATTNTERNSTIEEIKNLFGKKEQSDLVILAEGGSKEVLLHSFVVGLRPSVFSEHFKQQWGDYCFNFGACSLSTVNNFFKAFYLTDDEIETYVTFDLEFCFLALLFRVEFLLSKVNAFLEKAERNAEVLLMLYDCSVRMKAVEMVETLKQEIKKNLSQVIDSVYFQFLRDDEILTTILED